ncbi:hypothetical protein C900_05892 [Fulvivirga imtechensis AK7]|uniref:Uncharacterized protein n=1 Tax=Fulvivirga imtechensis AK7 TaxID=1237149 RepID=L8JMG1_9BACT|nr:hypothetical protein [Fulvivirga imtechensis]ELR68709.1 hypothetical protein C900_05892 [Fulvivirga imtechensis AK7]
MFHQGSVFDQEFDTIQDLRIKAEELREIFTSYALEDEFPAAKESLQDVTRDLKQMEAQAADSFWGSAEYVMDEELFGFPDHPQSFVTQKLYQVFKCGPHAEK